MFYIKKYYRKFLIILIPILVIILLIFFNQEKESEVIIEESIMKIEENEIENINNSKINIKGAVVNPGVYEFKDGERVIDQTTPNMIQGLKGIFARKPLISRGI